MSVARQTRTPRSRTRLQRLGGPCLLVALLLAGVAGMMPAQAQEDVGPGYSLDATTDTNDTTATVVPITGTGETIVTVAVGCEPGTVHDPEAGLMVRFEPQTEDEWTTLTVSESTASIEFTTDECAIGAAKTTEITVRSSYSKEAPAFTTTTNTLVATLDDGPTTSVEWTEEIGFYPDYQAHFRAQIFKTGPGDTIMVPLQVENLGNGPIRIMASVGAESSDKLTWRPPAPFDVPSPLDDAEQAVHQIEIEVQAPGAFGYENRQDTLVLVIDGESAEDTSAVLERTQASAVIQTQGWGAGKNAETGELPVISTFMVVGVLSAFLAARRRRS